MTTKQASIGQTFGALMGTIQTTATTITGSIDSLADLSAMARTKTSEMLHVTRVKSAVNKQQLTETSIQEACIALTSRQYEIKKQLDASPELNDLYQANYSAARSAVNRELGLSA